MPDQEINIKLILKTRRQLSIGVLLIVLSVVLTVVASYPQIKKTMKLREEKNKEAEILEQLETKLTQLNQIKKDEDFQRASKVDEVLPSHKPLLELLTNLNSVGTFSKIAITNFTVSPGEITERDATLSAQLVEKQTTKKKNTPYDQLTLELQIAGELKNIKQFISVMELMSPLTSVTEIRLADAQTEVDEDFFTRASIILDTYFYDETIAFAVDSPLPKITKEQRGIFEQIISFTPPRSEEQFEIIKSERDKLFDIEKPDLETKKEDTIE